MPPLPRSFVPSDLAGHEMLAGLAPDALSEVFARARIRELPADAGVFAQGDAAARAYALLAGRVRIAQGGADGGQFLIRFVGPGEVFGTVSLFAGHHYPAQAVTVVASVEVSWAESDFLALIAAHPRIAVNLVRITGRRLREAQERLREFATERVESRIASTLLRLAGQAGAAFDGGTAIDFPLGQKDVADMCGATFSTVSRTLTAWQKEGILSSGRRHIAIHDLDRLKRLTLPKA